MELREGASASRDRFVVLRRLGTGGFGVVHEAIDKERGIRVAMKTLRLPDAETLYRFKREFRGLANLSHPNLVKLYELFVEGKSSFFTMELVDGVNVASYVRSLGEGSFGELDLGLLPVAHPRPSAKTRRLSGSFRDSSPSIASDPPPSNRTARGPVFDEGRLRNAFLQLAEGIAFLHGAGKLHCDVKPSNVLVTPEGRVVLLDFGLSADLDAPSFDMSMNDRVLGTPHYMSPEQALGAPLSPASDWYSVGAMLFEALTGTLPFEGDGRSVMAHKQRVDPIAPSELSRFVPRDLDWLCLALLSRTPAHRPEQQDVLRALGGERPLTRTPTLLPTGRFVGRKNHREKLAAAYSDAQRGASVTVLLTGSSGAGKSTLLRKFLDDLRRADPDAIVLDGRCYEQESVPYKALDSIIDATARELRAVPKEDIGALLPRDIWALARLFPVLRQVEAVELASRASPDLSEPLEVRRRAFEALRQLVSRLTELAPVVLAIDDLQWGDSDSAALLAHLLRAPGTPQLLFVGAFREEDEERSPCLRALLPLLPREGPFAVRPIAVGPLEAGEALELAELLVPDGADPQRVAREAGGRPFFIAELARHLEESRADETTASELSPSIEDVVRRRLARLQPHARRVVELCALARRPLPLGAITLAAELGPDALSVIAELRAERLVRAVAADEVEAYHDRIRGAVLSTLTDETRATLSRELAGALERHGGADDETLAWLYREGNDRPRARDHAVRAAEEAELALGFERAVRLYQMALSVSDGSSDDERTLRVRLAAALVHSGQGTLAARQFRRASDGAPPQRALELRTREAEQLFIAGRFDDAVGVLKDVLRALSLRFPEKPAVAFAALVGIRSLLAIRGLKFKETPPYRIPPDDLLRIDATWSATVGLSPVDLIRGSYFSALHLWLALRGGEPWRVYRALWAEVTHLAARGGLEPSDAEIRVAERADAILATIPHPAADGLRSLYRGIAFFLRSDTEPALASFDRAERVLFAHPDSTSWEIGTIRVFRAQILFGRGEWATLCDSLPTMLREAREREDLYSETSLRTLLGHVPYLVDDDPVMGREDIEASLSSWSRSGYYLQHHYALLSIADTLLYEDEGRGGRALERVEAAFPRMRAALLTQVQLFRGLAWSCRARAALAAAANLSPGSLRRRALLRRAEADARSLQNEPARWTAPFADLHFGALASLTGDKHRAATFAERAADRFREQGVQHYAAAASHRAGELLEDARGDRHREASRAWMEAQHIRAPEKIVAMLAPGWAGKPLERGHPSFRCLTSKRASQARKRAPAASSAGRPALANMVGPRMEEPRRASAASTMVWAVSSRGGVRPLPRCDFRSACAASTTAESRTSIAPVSCPSSASHISTRPCPVVESAENTDSSMPASCPSSPVDPWMAVTSRAWMQSSERAITAFTSASRLPK
jgi:eukaryotic-like serine/threonine-protein kinase